MSSRMAEQGMPTNGGKTLDDQDHHAKIGNSNKDFLSKLKQEADFRNLSEMNHRISSSSTGSATSPNNHHSSISQPNRYNNSRPNGRPSCGRHSPNSSEESIGRHSVTSPSSANTYPMSLASMFAENSRMSQSPYHMAQQGGLIGSALAPQNHHQAAAAAVAALTGGDLNDLANHFNPAVAAAAGLPMGPMSPLNAAMSRLFLQNTIPLLGKHLTELQSEQQHLQFLANASQFLPLHTLNSVLNPVVGATSLESSPAVVSNVTQVKQPQPDLAEGNAELAGLPEQDGPIDLSRKSLSELKELTLQTIAKWGSGKHSIPGDQDSGFSPSSNEDNQHLHTSPLDLTAKRVCSAKRPTAGDSCPQPLKRNKLSHPADVEEDDVDVEVDEEVDVDQIDEDVDEDRRDNIDQHSRETNDDEDDEECIENLTLSKHAVTSLVNRSRPRQQIECAP